MGFEVDKELIEVPAVTLTQPTLHFANMPAPKKSNPNTKPIATASTKTLDLGRWDLKNVEFAETPVKLDKLHMLALKNCFGTPDVTSDDPKVGNATLNEVHTKFLAHIKAHGTNMEQGTTESEQYVLKASPITEAPFGDEGVFRKLINFAHESNSDCSIILIPEKNYKLYAFAKRVTDFKQRHVLFAVGSKFLQDGAQQFMSKLSLKSNMKFGGASHHLHAQTLDNLFGKTPKLGQAIKNKTIILGADIGHCGTGGKDGSPSVACVVGSVDNKFMTYPDSMRLQQGGQEVSTIMKFLRS